MSENPTNSRNITLSISVAERVWERITNKNFIHSEVTFLHVTLSRIFTLKTQDITLLCMVLKPAKHSNHQKKMNDNCFFIRGCYDSEYDAYFLRACRLPLYKNGLSI